ncbi:tRNA glutamyl-Q(34) synthetase GluQRS [Nakamurella deserti]|uniref:tRNA glutamyl-Q(34) synthetase GluQRS n=1 Tax=Nakamurella deserti TaxID=2164074 RepID=UPI000DBE2A6C|nr:tRNA glutamyl-Q(34) synthetase GluQRS [Nakamurella deserti]
MSPGATAGPDRRTDRASADPGQPATRGAGRFAPSPSGTLHLGNLRTALLAWLFARSTGRAFLVRMEDLDRVAAGAAAGQLRDLTALGIDHDGPVLQQSRRAPVYDAAMDRLTSAGLTYPCFCTRREIREAASAPQADGRPGEGRYPGTCRRLTADEVAVRTAQGRPSALRLRRRVDTLTFHDVLQGAFAGPVEDIVLRRNDGLAAYNLAVVVDDAAQGVDQVVRGDDLLPSTPAQVHLATLLGLPVPTYGHVPLALNPVGARLAKRDGAVTLPDLTGAGWTVPELLALIARSAGLTDAATVARAADLLAGFDPARLPREPWIVDPAELRRDAG